MRPKKRKEYKDIEKGRKGGRRVLERDGLRCE